MTRDVFSLHGSALSNLPNRVVLQSVCNAMQKYANVRLPHAVSRGLSSMRAAVLEVRHHLATPRRLSTHRPGRPHLHLH